jgi:mannose-6-phosphate isomerase-like protein (cupin superfamily)
VDLLGAIITPATTGGKADICDRLPAMLEKVNIVEKLGLFSAHYEPKIAARVNDTLVKLVKFQGDFVWHRHESEDEMFLVLHGTMTMRLRDGDVQVREGEFIVIPRGVEHMPTCEDEVHVMLIEPETVLNTGDVNNELTRKRLEEI